MTKKSVDVYLLAQARAGIERETLVRNLAALFKKDVPAIEKILAKPRTLIKTGVDAATAEKYCRAIRQAGCDCELLEREVISPPLSTAPTPAPQSPMATENSHASAPAGVESTQGKDDAENTSLPAQRDVTTPEPEPESGAQTAVRPGFALPVAILVVILIAVTLTVLTYRNKDSLTKSSAGSAVSAAGKNAQPDTGETQPKAVPNPPELLRSYSDDKRISLTTPTDWKGERRLNPEAAIGVANLRENLYAVVLRENKADFGGRFDLFRYSELIAQGLEKSTQEFQVQQAPRQLVINGLAARQASLAAKVDGINIIYLITTLETAEHFYVIYAWTLATRFESHQALLKQVSESFRVH